MNLSLFLFLIGILGFVLNRKNIILMIIAIEIMLLAVTLLVLISSFSFDDNVGQTFSVYIITIAGAESVIGLSILIAFYRSYVAITSLFFKLIRFINLNINRVTQYLRLKNKNQLSVRSGRKNNTANVKLKPLIKSGVFTLNFKNKNTFFALAATGGGVYSQRLISTSANNILKVQNKLVKGKTIKIGTKTLQSIKPND